MSCKKGKDCCGNKDCASQVSVGPVVKDEPPPTPNDQPSVWLAIINDMVPDAGNAPLIRDMKERHALGIARYKMPLQPFNGRNQLVDLYQELLDGTAYARSWRMEGNVDSFFIYETCLSMAATVRRLLTEQGHP